MTSATQKYQERCAVGSGTLFGDDDGPYKVERNATGHTITGPGMCAQRSWVQGRYMHTPQGDLALQHVVDWMNFAWRRAIEDHCADASEMVGEGSRDG